MPTNNERREVARRLRELSKDTEEVSDFDLAETLELEAVSRYGYSPEDVLRLADLIDPEPERTCRIEPDPDDPDAEKPWHMCRRCGYTRSIEDWSEWSYCPCCGARVIDGVLG